MSCNDDLVFLKCETFLFLITALSLQRLRYKSDGKPKDTVRGFEW